ncbi:hypothetical protein LUZ62_042954 [Rhynchospora pubera]|uniref:protein-serine/threonine phosphatase n=1 Tax=Rhynchospora pubera TaxID=906938 RepID=A0AAV8FLR3_9POAL|nr:hypothetical protein LUZ62_042954 [Rhynchospora pubera]
MGCVNGKCCLRRRYRGSHSQNPSSSRHANSSRCQIITDPTTLGSTLVPSHGLLLQYSALSHRGHYPDSPDRENQDSFIITTELLSNPNLHLFGVFDGHGAFGTECARFVRDRLPEVLCSDSVTLIADPAKAFHEAFLTVNSELHANPDIDDSMSGTTAIVVLVYGDMLYVANVGDSRAVAGVLCGDDSVKVEDLSSDQTPFREDEKERVQKCGARVLTAGQVEAAAAAAIDGTHIPETEATECTSSEADEGDPPRLWVRDGMYPGTAFTRSVGDLTAEGIGVVADPEVRAIRISPSHIFFALASDGVFEFLSSQGVVDMVSKFSDPREACTEIVSESYRLWLEHESRTDDITIIVVHIQDSSESGSLESHQVIQTKIKDERFAIQKHPEASSEMNSCFPLSDPGKEHSLSCVTPSPAGTVS